MSFETELAATAWDATGDEEPWHRLLATFTVNGTQHHLEAIAVRTVRANGKAQQALDPRLNPALEAAGVICGWPVFQTSRIEDHEYVVVMTPHALR